MNRTRSGPPAYRVSAHECFSALVSMALPGELGYSPAGRRAEYVGAQHCWGRTLEAARLELLTDMQLQAARRADSSVRQRW